MPPKTRSLLVRCVLAAFLLSFLLPFASLSCGNKTLCTFSGVQLATGMGGQELDGLRSGEKKGIDLEPMALLAGVLAVAALGLAFAPGKGAAVASGVAALLGTLFLVLLRGKVGGDVSGEAKGLVQVNWEIGWFVALLTSLAGGVLAFLPGKGGKAAEPGAPPQA